MFGRICATIVQPLFQIDEFSSAEPTAQENRHDGSISFALRVVHVRKLPLGASLIHGQRIPKPHASFFASFTRRMPAVSSGLKSPVSDASPFEEKMETSRQLHPLQFRYSCHRMSWELSGCGVPVPPGTTQISLPFNHTKMSAPVPPLK
jgi:hypothetical protein